MERKLKNLKSYLNDLIDSDDRIIQLTNRVKQLEKKIKHMEKGQSCIFCKSFNVIKQGLRKTKSRGPVQKYHCLTCDKKFSESDLHERRMRNSRLDIELALKLRENGLSLSQIAKKLDNRVTRQTVLSWTKKFNRKV